MSADWQDKLSDPTKIDEAFAELGYISNDRIATAVFLAQQLTKPILVEGPPGVGKTELAIATSEMLGIPLIRLQCYEGLDEAKALYEWKYGKQLLYTQVLKEKLADVMEDARTLPAAMDKLHSFSDIFFSHQFLEPRPLLKALEAENGAVLLIDEIDKSDYEFEAYLLEILSAYQISVPEIGVVRAKIPPIVFLTSNNTREMGDALKRRCLHLYIPFPDEKTERRIVEARVPEVAESLRKQIVSFVHGLREEELKKLPAISETIDWARTLLLLNTSELDVDTVRRTINVLLKFQEDVESTDRQLYKMVRDAKDAV